MRRNTRLDLNLPRTAPGVARHHGQNHDGLPVALYALVHLSDQELDELRQACEQEDIACGSEPGSVVSIARPQARFAEQPLSAVLDAHLGLPEPLRFNPIYLIVAFDRGWKANGVLLVALDDDDLRCRVDRVRVDAHQSGLAFVNLQIGNEGWRDVRSGYSLDEIADDDDKKKKEDEEENGDRYNDDSGPERPKAPSNDQLKHGLHYIGIYVAEGVDTEALLRTLEPAYRHKKPKDYLCRIQAVLSLASSSPVDQAFNLHPVRCRKSPWMHKQMFLVVDSAEARDMTLARLDWDGDTTSRTKEELRAVAADRSIARKTRLLPKTALEGIQYGFISIMQGDAVF